MTLDRWWPDARAWLAASSAVIVLVQDGIPDSPPRLPRRGPANPHTLLRNPCPPDSTSKWTASASPEACTEFAKRRTSTASASSPLYGREFHGNPGAFLSRRSIREWGWTTRGGPPGGWVVDSVTLNGKFAFANARRHSGMKKGIREGMGSFGNANFHSRMRAPVLNAEMHSRMGGFRGFSETSLHSCPEDPSSGAY